MGNALLRHTSDLLISEEKVVYLTPEEEKDKTFFTDAETGVEMELMDCSSLLEWFANNYQNYGTTLEIVTDRSQEGNQFVKGFGGIGGTVHHVLVKLIMLYIVRLVLN